MTLNPAGFTADAILTELADYQAKDDKFLKSLAVTTDRIIHIVTYGTRFIFEPPSGVQKIFDASVLNGKRNKDIIKLRGTSLKIQQLVRDADGFVKFFTELIKSVEVENLTFIAITCKAGHHRSVACAEILRYVYPNATVEHLTMS